MRSFRCCFLISLASLLLYTVEAAAQAVPVGWQTDTTLSAKKNDYFGLLKANNIDSDRQGVEKFFDNFYFSRWTLPANTGQVRNFSQELLTQDFKDLAGGSRDYLLNKSFDTLRKMAADPTVTPTARFNAIYTIGSLNQREAPNASSPPVPYAQALAYLVKELDNKNNPEYLHLGALLGIQRHALAGINDGELKDTTLPAVLVKIVQEGKPAPNRDADDQEIIDCFRYRAVETLGALKGTGSRGEIVDLLLSVMENSQESIDLRCFAAKTLAELNFQAASTAGVQINYQRIGTVLLSLTKATCDIELRRIEDVRGKEKAKAGIGPLQPGMADVDPDYTALSPEVQHEVLYSVQRLKNEFYGIMMGVRGPRPTGTTTIGVLPMLPEEDPIATKLNSTVKAITQLFKYLDDGPTDKPAPVAAAAGLDPMGGGLAPAAKPDPKALKVNLALIRDKLQEFSTTLDGIISG